MQFHRPTSCEWGVFYLAQAKLGKAAKCLEEVRLAPLNQTKPVTAMLTVTICSANERSLRDCGPLNEALALQTSARCHFAESNADCSVFKARHAVLSTFGTLTPGSLSAFHFSRISKH